MCLVPHQCKRRPNHPKPVRHLEPRVRPSWFRHACCENIFGVVNICTLVHRLGNINQVERVVRDQIADLFLGRDPLGPVVAPNDLVVPRYVNGPNSEEAALIAITGMKSPSTPK